jgi:hypothetical protein
VDDECVSRFRGELRALYPDATLFKAGEDQANELVGLMQTLSLSSNLLSGKGDLNAVNF